jgi:DNA-binding transcriptional regulator LsrR (DeoR family)
MADESTDIKPYHGANRASVARFVKEGMRDKDIAAMLGITRQRVEQLRKAQGLARIPKHNDYPKERPCISQKGGVHTFISESYDHQRCDLHTRHIAVCDVCGHNYKTNGYSTTCHPCRNRANARRQRERQLLQRGLAQ